MAYDHTTYDLAMYRPGVPRLGENPMTNPSGRTWHVCMARLRKKRSGRNEAGKAKTAVEERFGLRLEPQRRACFFSLQPMSLGRSADITRTHSMWNCYCIRYLANDALTTEAPIAIAHPKAKLLTIIPSACMILK